jgi:hypothetical protein
MQHEISDEINKVIWSNTLTNNTRAGVLATKSVQVPGKEEKRIWFLKNGCCWDCSPRQRVKICSTVNSLLHEQQVQRLHAVFNTKI